MRHTATVTAGYLRSQVSALAPYLSDLLDPAFFLEQTRLPDFPQTFPIEGVRYIGVRSADYLRLLVTADHDPDDEFTALVDAWESDTNWTTAAWLRARHAAHR